MEQSKKVQEKYYLKQNKIFKNLIEHQIKKFDKTPKTKNWCKKIAHGISLEKPHTPVTDPNIVNPK